MSNELYRDFIDRKLTEVDNDIVSKLDDVIDAINQNIDLFLEGNLTTLISNVTSARRDFAFASTSLVNVIMPNLTNLPVSAFNSCTSLIHVELDNVLTITSNSFYACPNLPLLDFPKLNSINGSGAFAYCNNFGTLILRNSSMVSLSDVSSFQATKFGSGTAGTGGKLYVPQSLISTYQADAKWSAVLALNANNQILAIEGSPYEN